MQNGLTALRALDLASDETAKSRPTSPILSRSSPVVGGLEHASARARGIAGGCLSPEVAAIMHVATQRKKCYLQVRHSRHCRQYVGASARAEDVEDELDVGARHVFEGLRLGHNVKVGKNERTLYFGHISDNVTTLASLENRAFRLNEGAVSP
jgi:hypothetical protein